MNTDIETESTNEMILTVGYGDEFVRVWVDFNDDFIFDLDELIIDNHEIANGESSGEYTDTLTFIIPEDAQLGEHLMRIKTNWNAGVPDDACAETEYGETEDYTLNVVLPTGTIALREMDSELEIVHLGNDHYEVSLITEKLDNQVIINLHNSLGINLVENKVTYVNDRYTYPLDMSYATSGVYIIRMGTHKYGKVKKLIIK
jgi:hypothetical protein